MILVKNDEECCGCSACASVCPVSCITMQVDTEGFPYPKVDTARCIDCGKCERVCPFLNDRDTVNPLNAYAARSVDDEVRLESSSGGVFTELCHPILAANGVVYGVAMDADCRSCSFTRVESEKELAPLRGSKYLQAESQGVWERVAEDLKAGRSVLFSGTPCQTNALYAYLGGAHDGLTMVDFICHGVPSARLWAEHLALLEERKNAKVESVNFRCKEAEWKKLSLQKKRGGLVSFELFDKSPFSRMFLRDYCLRPSCYACKAKLSRSADITIADFWGVESVAPDMADELGCSLVIIRTKRGTNALEEISGRLKTLEVPYEEAVRGNPSVRNSAARSLERELFFDDLDELGYERVARKYGSVEIRERGKDVLEKFGLLTLRRKLLGMPPINSMRYGILTVFRSSEHERVGLGK